MRKHLLPDFNVTAVLQTQTQLIRIIKLKL